MTSCQPYQTNWNDAKITNIYEYTKIMCKNHTIYFQKEIGINNNPIGPLILHR